MRSNVSLAPRFYFFSPFDFSLLLLSESSVEERGGSVNLEIARTHSRYRVGGFPRVTRSEIISRYFYGTVELV